jgi:hypothetical protein
MKVIRRGSLPNGNHLTIEDWSKDYNRPYGATVVAYDISKVSLPGAFAPKGGEVYRFGFDFATNEEADAAFEELASGRKTPGDYREHMEEPRYGPCV